MDDRDTKELFDLLRRIATNSDRIADALEKREQPSFSDQAKQYREAVEDTR